MARPERKAEARFKTAAELVRANHVSRGRQKITSKGLLPDTPPQPGETEGKLQKDLRGKFLPAPRRQAPAASGPYPSATFTSDDVRDKDGAFGPRMPRLKAAGLDGWRLEHLAHLVTEDEQAADAFARFVTWITAEHAAGGGPSARFMAMYGSAQVLPFRKESNSDDPRPVTPPSGLNRGVERVIDAKFSAQFLEAGGSMQFGYRARSGTEQVVQLVRIATRATPSASTTSPKATLKNPRKRRRAMTRAMTTCMHGRAGGRRATLSLN